MLRRCPFVINLLMALTALCGGRVERLVRERAGDATASGFCDDWLWVTSIGAGFVSYPFDERFKRGNRVAILGLGKTSFARRSLHSAGAGQCVGLPGAGLPCSCSSGRLGDRGARTALQYQRNAHKGADEQPKPRKSSHWQRPQFKFVAVIYCFDIEQIHDW